MSKKRKMARCSVGTLEKIRKLKGVVLYKTGKVVTNSDLVGVAANCVLRDVYGNF